MLINQKDLDYWIESNLNVLFKGKHGSGKTARVIELFEKHNLKWKYFSASTMDPWVDFVGIPKEKVDDKGHHYLDFIRPREMEEDEVEAIFFDEFNRCPKKVLNAVMELIQFKSINGRKFKKLRFIWAAVNENLDDEQTYSVETIDPAQLDRFQVHVDVPYKLDPSYFITKFGKDVFKSTSDWWDQLSPKIKDTVSPRRVDYALEIWRTGGNVSYVLPKASNPHNLLTLLSTGSFKDKFTKLVKNNFTDVVNEMKNVNFVEWVTSNMTDDSIYQHADKFIEFIPDDMVSKSINDNSKKSKYLEALYDTPKGQKIIGDIKNANVAKPAVILRIEKLIAKKNPNAPLPQFLDLENRLDISKLTSSTARLKAFEYIIETFTRGITVTAQEMLYITCLLNYIKDHTTLPSFTSKYGTDWPRVLNAMVLSIDAAVQANPNVSQDVRNALDEMKAWQEEIKK